MEKVILNKKEYKTEEKGKFTIIRAIKGKFKKTILTSRFKTDYELKEVKEEKAKDSKGKE